MLLSIGDINADVNTESTLNTTQNRTHTKALGKSRPAVFSRELSALLHFFLLSAFRKESHIEGQL